MGRQGHEAGPDTGACVVTTPTVTATGRAATTGATMLAAAADPVVCFAGMTPRFDALVTHIFTGKQTCACGAIAVLPATMAGAH